MNCLEKKASEKFEQEALSFYIALANAFRPEETQEEVPRIHLQPEDDFAETVRAMLTGMQVLCENASSELHADDLIGFTHILNRLAIQHYFLQHDDKDEQ